MRKVTCYKVILWSMHQNFNSVNHNYPLNVLTH